MKIFTIKNVNAESRIKKNKKHIIKGCQVNEYMKRNDCVESSSTEREKTHLFTQILVQHHSILLFDGEIKIK